MVKKIKVVRYINRKILQAIGTVFKKQPKRFGVIWFEELPKLYSRKNARTLAAVWFEALWEVLEVALFRIFNSGSGLSFTRLITFCFSDFYCRCFSSPSDRRLLILLVQNPRRSVCRSGRLLSSDGSVEGPSSREK